MPFYYQHYEPIDTKFADAHFCGDFHGGLSQNWLPGCGHIRHSLGTLGYDLTKVFNLEISANELETSAVEIYQLPSGSIPPLPARIRTDPIG
jgi:hypothetical protein